MLKLKLQYFGHLMWRVDSLEKTDAGRDWGQEEKGTTEMAGWHHWLNGRESEWTLGVGDGQGGLACCNSWGRKESDTTERLNWSFQHYRTFLSPHKRNLTAVTNHHSLYPSTINLFSSCGNLPILDILRKSCNTWGFSCGSAGKECLQCRRPGFNPWVGKIPWKRERLPTLVF